MKSCNISAGGHAGFLFENLGKILGIVSAADLFRYILDFIVSGRNQKLFSPFNPNFCKIIREPDSGFLLEFFAYVIGIHKQMLFCNLL